MKHNKKKTAATAALRKSTQPAAKAASPATKKNKIAVGLEVIPPDETDPESLQVLEVISNLFHSKVVSKKLHSWVETKEVAGVRVIQGRRFEVFVRAGKGTERKETDCFDQLVREEIHNKNNSNDEYEGVLKDKTVDQVRDILLSYAERQARKDPRLGDLYEFDNFSLLVSYVAREAQYPHIDLLYPNVQCGMALTDKSPATISYETEHHIKTVDDLRAHASTWKSMPASLAETMRKDPHCTQMLQQFGDTLHPELHEIKQTRLLKRGSLVTLPGSVIHAGPASKGYRCLLFFSGWRKGSAVAQYNPDIQYFKPLLCADMFSLLYHKLSVPDRLYMIERLAEMVPQYKHLYRHLTDEAMKKFTNALAWAQYGPGGKEELMQTFAEGKGIVPKGLPTVSTKKSDDNLKLVSVDDLSTVWEGVTHNIQVFQLGDDDPQRVQLFYPGDSSWEGNLPDQRYTLRRSIDSSKRATRNFKFDGTNGVLLDHEGNEIQCFRQEQQSQAR